MNDPNLGVYLPHRRHGIQYRHSGLIVPGVIRVILCIYTYYNALPQLSGLIRPIS